MTADLPITKHENNKFKQNKAITQRTTGNKLQYKLHISTQSQQTYTLQPVNLQTDGLTACNTAVWQNCSVSRKHGDGISNELFYKTAQRKYMN